MRRVGGPRQRRWVVVLLAVLLCAACSDRDADPEPDGGDGSETSETRAKGPADGGNSLLGRYSLFYGGAPGGMVPNRVIGTHLQVPCQGIPGCKSFAPGILLVGADVSRSPASGGAQTATLFSYINKPDPLFGGWRLEIEDAQRVVIPVGAQSARFGDRSFLPNAVGWKYVTHVVVWHGESGQDLGWQAYAMNHAADYMCQTQFTLDCYVGDGFVSIDPPGP